RGAHLCRLCVSHDGPPRSSAGQTTLMKHPLSVVGARVYAVGAGAAHAVYAFNRANGQLLWTRVLDHIVMTQPLVAGNRIVVGSGNNYMRANPVRDWRTVIRGTGSNAIYALDAATGAVLWRRPV